MDFQDLLLIIEMIFLYYYGIERKEMVLDDEEDHNYSNVDKSNVLQV